MEIGITTESARVQDADLAFIVKACSQQAEEFCAAWGLPVVPVAFYKRGTVLSLQTTHALVIVDDLDAPGALGYHTDEAGVIYAKVLAQDTEATGLTVSHEVLEMIGDPKCNDWRPYSAGRLQAKEACDRCEADSYSEPTTVLGETRGIPVSNYLLPAAFAENSVGPWDRMGRLPSWDAMSPGGYVILRDQSGNVTNVFAERGKVPSSFGRKLTNPQSRTLRRLRSPMA